MEKNKNYSLKRPSLKHSSPALTAFIKKNIITKKTADFSIVFIFIQNELLAKWNEAKQWGLRSIKVNHNCSRFSVQNSPYCLSVRCYDKIYLSSLQPDWWMNMSLSVPLTLIVLMRWEWFASIIELEERNNIINIESISLNRFEIFCF